MRNHYERAVKVPPENRRSDMKIKAKRTQHYKVAGRLLKNQVVDVDPDMGNKLIGMYPDDLEEVGGKAKRKPKKEKGENVLTEKNIGLQGMAEKAEESEEE